MGAAAPGCRASAEVNLDGKLDVADTIYLFTAPGS
jgi:hypothetical protein